jgi:hypothetical protein
MFVSFEYWSYSPKGRGDGARAHPARLGRKVTKLA